jgi:integrase
VGQYSNETDVVALLKVALETGIAPVEMGGPTVARVGDLLHRYAHQFTILKGGWHAELTRINHYLVGAGLAPLEGFEENGVRRLRQKSSDIGSTTPSGWRGHRDSRLAKRKTTYALIHAIAAMPCAQVTTSVLRALHTTMRAEGLSESTVQKEFAVLKAAFNVAIREWGWAGAVNPAIGIRLGRSRSRFVRLTDDEEQRLVDALAACDNPEFWPLVELALTSTMRRGSLLKLQWSNIDLEQRQVHVWAKGFDVTLPLSKRAVDLLRLVPRNDTGRVFTMTANGVKMAWQRTRTRAGLPHLRFADLRHLGATFYARAGLNAHQLRHVLGHRTTAMAEVYVNLVANDVAEALDRAEAKQPVQRPLPPSDVHAGPKGRAIMAERRTARLNGPPKLPQNVVRLIRRGDLEPDG